MMISFEDNLLRSVQIGVRQKSRQFLGPVRVLGPKQHHNGTKNETWGRCTEKR